ELVGKEHTPTLAGNVITAMAYAGYKAVIDMANSPAYNDNEAINKLLGRDAYAEVTTDMYELLHAVGGKQNTVQNSIGKAVVSALGLRLKADAPQELGPNLEATVGALVVKAMLEPSVNLFNRHS